MLARHLLVCALPWALLEPGAVAQQFLGAIQEREATTRFGSALAAVGDLDGDGLEDFAVGSPAALQGGVRLGRLDVLSGGAAVNGQHVVLASTVGPAVNSGGNFVATSFAVSLDGGRDIDGDGTPDHVVGAPGAGRVIAYSGATFRDLLAGASGDLNGGLNSGHGTVVRLLDADGDTFADVLVTRRPSSLGTPGSYQVLRGAWIASGGASLPRVLHSNPGLAAPLVFGSVACVVGDLDGDAREDFALGGGGGPGWVGGYVEVRSGATGALLLQLGAPTQAGTGSVGFGRALVGLGDVDGDGLPELAAAVTAFQPSAGSARGAVEVIRGAFLAGVPGAQRTLRWHAGPLADSALGRALGAADYDRDGVRDVVAALRSPREDSAVRVLSGRTGALLADIASREQGLGLGGVADLPLADALVLGDPLSAAQATDAGEVQLWRR